MGAEDQYILYIEEQVVYPSEIEKGKTNIQTQSELVQ